MSSLQNIDDVPAGAEVQGASGVRAFLASETGLRFLYLAIGAVAIAIVFGVLQYSTSSICCGDLDGFYHVKWSQLLWQGLRTGHFPPAFTWLPLTTLNAKDYVDHHLLFHLILIPFTSFGDPRVGAKVATMLFGSLAVFACYWLIVRYRISYPLLWLVALLGCSAPFLFRMNMTKAMSISIVLLIAGVVLLFERRYIWLLPLMFVFALTYDMFVLLGLAAFIWAMIMYWSERRLEWRLILLVSAGALAGFVINPYFPHNIRLFVEHIAIKVTAEGFSTDVGGEWYPYNTLEFLGNSFVACAAMITGYIAFDWRDRKRSRYALFFLIFATALLVANARWKRFAEYWPAFAVLFAAFSVQRLFDRAGETPGELPPEVLDDLQPYLDRHEPEEVVQIRKRRENWRLITAGIVAAFICVPLGLNIRQEIKEIRSTNPPDDYKAAMAWIQSNVPAGQIVFNTNWDNFPKMFFYDTTHPYVSGLDPTYLLDQNQDLAKLYDQIRLGKEKDPGPIIRDRFGARYVFTSEGDIGNDFYNNALDSGWFEEVYVDDHCTVMRIRDEKGEPPPDEDDAASGDQDKNQSDQQDQEDTGDEEDDGE